MSPVRARADDGLSRLRIHFRQQGPCRLPDGYIVTVLARIATDWYFLQAACVGVVELNRNIQTIRSIGWLLSESATQFLYLTTLGWKTGKRHQIEIWFVEQKGRYYVLSERKKNAHWVQNIAHAPAVSFSVSGKSSAGIARIVSAGNEKELSEEISRLMKEKYGWGDGLIVELAPEN